MIKEILRYIAALFGISEAQIIYEPYTGRPSQVLPKIKRRITRLIRDKNYGEIYIGRTSYPEERLSQHEKEKGTFDRMLVVYKTSSSEYAHKVESELIRHYRKSDRVNVLNEVEGSSGSEGESPYYVYVLLR